MNAEELVDKLGRWARSRRGVTVLLLSAWATVANIRDLRSAAAAPLLFIAAAVIFSPLVWLAARAWEQRTWPATPAFARSRGAGSGTGMLRVDHNARVFSDHRGFLFERRCFFVGTGCPPTRLLHGVDALAKRQRVEPVRIAANGSRTWWWYQDGFCWENEGYDSRDISALLAERARRKEHRLERAHMLMRVEQDPGGRREPIPREIRRAVFERDGGRCVECGSNFDLQYDHIIPVALGGSTTVGNLQLLCASRNQAKGASI